MSKLLILTVAAVALCTASVARADPTPASDEQGPKDPTTALELSLGGTAASGALLGIGIGANNGGMIAAGLLSSLVTPSLGEWYAGKPVTLGMGLRAASAFVLLAGLSESLKCLDSEEACQSNTNEAEELVIGGLVGYAGGTIYDIAMAPSAARAFNREHQIHLAPTYMRTPSGNATMGVGIGGTF